MQSYFAAFVCQGYFASAFPNVSRDLSLMAIDHIVGVVCEMQPYVCKDRAIPGDIGLAIDFNIYKYAYRVRQGNL